MLWYSAICFHKIFMAEFSIKPLEWKLQSPKCQRSTPSNIFHHWTCWLELLGIVILQHLECRFPVLSFTACKSKYKTFITPGMKPDCLNSHSKHEYYLPRTDASWDFFPSQHLPLWSPFSLTIPSVLACLLCKCKAKFLGHLCRTIAIPSPSPLWGPELLGRQTDGRTQSRIDSVLSSFSTIFCLVH